MAVAVFLFGSVAVAAGNGSQTSTEHAHGTDVSQLGALGIVAPPDLPAGCPLALPAALVPVSGNAVQHQTTNKAGDFWFTSTVTADVDVYAAQVIDEE